MNRICLVSLLLFSCAVIYSCQNSQSQEPAGPGGWLRGNTGEKFDMVARQLRGFDMAMAETGYRYQELYWAGKDQNWGYAKYQVEKIRTAIENGLIRRPERAKSAEGFLKYSLTAMEEAVSRKDTALFNRNIQLLTSACNSCHNAGKVEFVTVQMPAHRISPVRFQTLTE